MDRYERNNNCIFTVPTVSHHDLLHAIGWEQKERGVGSRISKSVPLARLDFPYCNVGTDTNEHRSMDCLFEKLH